MSFSLSVQLQFTTVLLDNIIKKHNWDGLPDLSINMDDAADSALVEWPFKIQP